MQKISLLVSNLHQRIEAFLPLLPHTLSLSIHFSTKKVYSQLNNVNCISGRFATAKTGSAPSENENLMFQVKQETLKKQNKQQVTLLRLTHIFLGLLVCPS